MILELDARLAYADFTFAAALRRDLAGITGVFGPSGGGKTTLLRIIAGLERAAGRVSFGGECWQDDSRGLFVPPHRRRVGYVFQDARLFAHLDVAGNLRYALRRRAGPISYEEVVRVLDLVPLLARRPASLSGGERQRVAIGRALLSQPSLLLLDEPLSALDRGRRSEILPYLRMLPDTFHLPLLYVTHEVEEIAALSRRVLLMEGGRISGEESPAALLARAGRSVAAGGAAGQLRLTLENGRLVSSAAAARAFGLEEGGSILAEIRPGDSR